MLADEIIRKQALEPDKSFIVQAPAGSGKTELLIQRYLKLLGRANFPEEILAMTFTRKAAAEMKDRIFSALTEAQTRQRPEQAHARFTWELAQKVLEQDKTLEWELMNNPARLRIVTIDSFCSSLTRRMPLLSRMGAGLDIQENARSLYQETARSILSLTESETNPYGVLVRNILRHIDNSKEDFIKRIVQLLTKRDQWMISFFDPRENLEEHPLNERYRQKLEQTLAKLIQSQLGDLQGLFSPAIQESILQVATYSGRNLENTDPSNPCACLASLLSFPDTTIDSLDIWKGLAHLFLTTTKPNTYRKKPDVRLGFPAGKDAGGKKMKEAFQELTNTFQKNPAILASLVKVKKLPRGHFTDMEWDLLKSTIRLLAEINKRLKDVFSSRQITDFTEISLSAINSLLQKDEEGMEHPTDLLFYLDCKIHHILVDEYQDTSFKQEELLRRLTSEWSDEDGRTLFIVGDPKQSIYRFRDAEVGLFIKTQERGLGSLQLTPLSLESNFRSQKKLVDWVNSCFQKIFPANNDPDLGAISYAPSSAVLEEDKHPGVLYHPVPHHEDSQAISEKEAQKITALVEDLQSKYPNKSLAILVRGRTHLTSIVRHFNESKIAFKAEAIDSLTDRPAILDLLSLLRALRFPGDRTAWLSILRAPWCGLSFTDIHALVELDPATPIWFVLNDSTRIGLLSEDGQKRTKILVQNIHLFINGLADQNFRDVLEACWVKLGGPACLQGTNPDDIEVFFNKVEEIIASGQEEQFENFDQILTELYASPLAVPENAVQIMTMHKAKGLEFDFVILPGLGKPTKADEKRLIYWMPHGDDLLLAPIEEKGGETSPLYEFLSDLNKEKEEYETLRLLYVAATRAKSQLHLFGHLKPHKEETWKPSPKSLLNKLWPHIEEEWLEKLNEATESNPVQPEALAMEMHSIYRLPTAFSLPIPGEAISTGSVIDIEMEPEYDWAENSARCLGNVLHRCLHDIAVEGLGAWPQERIEIFKPRFKSALLAEGLPLEQAEKGLSTGLLALSRLFEDERGRWILSSHEDAHSEYPLTFFQDNRYIRNVIDRTFVEGGVRWIIDYKTGSHKGEGKNLEIFLDNEVQRYRHQLDRYEMVLRKFGEKRPIKKALYFPLLKAWREMN
ncbi:MAG: UvrD-helicase domain-containing protein [Nitrospina sp.]|jgi:ATP-dependent helicase/nuclease subunit A|nr:UvrD-helicase domain-containing protein [Nitrospina sp.]